MPDKNDAQFCSVCGANHEKQESYICRVCGVLNERLYRREHADPEYARGMTRAQIEAEYAACVECER